jgi:hypothetical protein
VAEKAHPPENPIRAGLPETEQLAGKFFTECGSKTQLFGEQDKTNPSTCQSKKPRNSG